MQLETTFNQVLLKFMCPPNHKTNPNGHSNGNIFCAHFVDTHKKVVSH